MIKRQETFKPSPEGGISIKGIANRSVRPSAQPYTPPSQRGERSNGGIHSRISSESNDKPSITTRLGSNSNGNNNHNNDHGHHVVQQRRIPANKPEETKSQSYTIPIVTGGKSNTLIMKGFKDQVRMEDVKKMTDGSPVKNTQLDQNDKSATVVFNTIEDAVTFRRKFNRQVFHHSL